MSIYMITLRGKSRNIYFVNLREYAKSKLIAKKKKNLSFEGRLYF